MGVDERDRIGIIGANGSGKSTLLKVISGQEIPDEGSVVVTEGTVISFLPQNPVFDSDATVLETVFKARSPAITSVSFISITFLQENTDKNKTEKNNIL